MRFTVHILLSSLAIAATTFSSNAIAKTFEVKNSIIIDLPQEEVFCFAGNPSNDVAWRSEVNEMVADGPWSVGTFYYEDSTLGLNPHYVTVTYMDELEYPWFMAVQTPEDSLFLRAERTFEALEDGRTRFTYLLEVDERMPRDATGVVVPTWLSKFYYGKVMRQYQSTLKRILESSPTSLCEQ